MIQIHQNVGSGLNIIQVRIYTVNFSKQVLQVLKKPYLLKHRLKTLAN